MSLLQDWKYPRSAKAFTGNYDNKMQGLTLKCITNSPIPCSLKEFQNMGGKVRFSATILSIHPGWAYAPFKKAMPGKKTFKDPNSKPLFEMVKENDVVTSARIYSFKKARANTDRDERDESIVSRVYIGQAVTFFIQNFMYESSDKKRPVFPETDEVIREFTLINLRVMISNNETEGGYGLKLQQVQVESLSLYSFLGTESLHLLPESEKTAKELNEERQSSNPFIMNNIDRIVALFLQVPAGSYSSPHPVGDQFRLLGPNSSELGNELACVDIHNDVLLSYSNQSTLEDAITLFDFASAKEALYIYVVPVKSYSRTEVVLSEYRGVPLVNVDRFLSDVVIPLGPHASVYEYDFPLNNLEISAKLTLDTESFRKPGPSAITKDFPILGVEFEVQKGYMLTLLSGGDTLLQFVFNVMGCPPSQFKEFKRLDYVKKRKAESPADE